MLNNYYFQCEEYEKTRMQKSKIIQNIIFALMLACSLVFSSCAYLFPNATNNAEVTLTQTEVTLGVGESVTLSATTVVGANVTWSSANEKIATVSGGVVFGVSEGTVVITAATKTALATCTVTVEGGALPDADIDGLSLVWNDEFNGTELDLTKWGYQLGTRDVYGQSRGPSGWGNNELQYYTEDAVSVEDGSLVITAERQNYEDMEYTSARILTRDLASFTYGYFEARMQLPTIQGMWPAFWMMPQPANENSTGNEYGGWPNSGELDIMEARGRVPKEVGNALHFGGYPNHQYLADSYATKTSIAEWHTYGVDWRPESITWYVDGEVSFKLTNSQWWTASSSEASAPFDKPFYILLNLAVGGNYDGGRKPPEDFVSASMYVDYVRVYEHNENVF